MKKLFTSSLLGNIKNLAITTIFCLGSFYSIGQCLNSTSWQTSTAPVTGATLTAVTGIYAGEYHTVNGVAANHVYVATSTIGTDFITIRQGTFNGPVIASGTSPLTWTATVAGTYFIHVNTNASCGTNTSPRDITLANITITAGEALKFDGVNDRVQMGTAITSSLTGSNAISVEAWVRPTSSAILGPIVGNYATVNTGLFIQFLLRKHSFGYYEFLIGNGSNFTSVNTPTYGLNTWQHVAATWNGTTAIIYVNGVQVASALTPTNITSLGNGTNNPVWIGGNNSGTGEFFQGDIDEVRIWKSVRTKCEINTFMNCEIPTNAPNLLANYHFNQGIAAGNNLSVSTLTDATSNAQTGTLTGIAQIGTISNWIAPGGVVSGFTIPAVPSFTNSALAICLGGTVVLGSTGATSFTWSPTITNNTAFTPTASTSYSYSGTNSVTTCSNIAVANVTVNPLPTLTVTGNTTICGTGTNVILACCPNSYTWSTGSNSNTISISPTITTNYTVSGTSMITGCSNTTTFTQVVSTNPTITALSSNTTFICTGQSVTLTASGASNYVWNTSATTAVIAVSPTTSTSYTVTGTNAQGCSAVAVVSQSVNTCTDLASLNQSESLLEIYPNPSSGEFNLKATREITVEVYNILGASILSTKIQAGDYKLNLSEQTRGIYIVKCTSQDQIKSYRLIKE